MLIPSSGGILRRQTASQPSDEPQVPLWAFIVMTVFSLILMGLIVVLLWRPDIFRSLHRTDLGGKERKLSSSPTLPVADRQEQQEQHPQQRAYSRASSLRKAWFRSGGSFRSNIDRWRRDVDIDEEAPSPNAVGGGSNCYEPVAHSYATPAARPISHMQRIPEYEHQGKP